MDNTAVIEQLFNLLLSGDRPRTRQFIGRVLASGMTPAQLTNDVIWPLHRTLFMHPRKDEVAPLAFTSAVRLLRTTIDQLQAGYEQSSRSGSSVLIFSGHDEIEDLGGQIAADMLEAAGWEVWFGGPLPATDDVVAEVHARRPAWLVLFSSSKDDAARSREVIESLRDIGGHPDLRIALGGGVFNRAPGLAEELGCDATAATPSALVDALAGRRATPTGATIAGHARGPASKSVESSRTRGRAIDGLARRRDAA